MAINKTSPTVYDIDITHHVLGRLVFNRDEEVLQMLISSYPDAAKFNGGAKALFTHTRSFEFDDLPTSVMTKIGELKELLEVEMINLLADFSGGTQVQDNGSPMP